MHKGVYKIISLYFKKQAILLYVTIISKYIKDLNVKKRCHERI